MAFLWSGDTQQLPGLRGEENADDKYGGGRSKKCCGHTVCGPNWQLTAILCVLSFGVLAFTGLLIGIVSKGDQLEATSKATVSMHDETNKMKADIEKALKTWRSNFPSKSERYE